MINVPAQLVYLLKLSDKFNKNEIGKLKFTQKTE